MQGELSCSTMSMHIFSFGVALESPPEAIGPVAEGIRVNFYCQGGEVTGPKLQGRCRSVGGDWLTIRTDGGDS